MHTCIHVVHSSFSILQPLCTQLGLCISSNHFQLAMHLFLFSNQRFVALLDQNVNELMSVLIGSIVDRCIWFVPSLTFWFDPQTHGKQLPTKCSLRLPWILSLSVSAQHAAEVRFFVSTWTLLFHYCSFFSFSRPLNIERQTSSRRHGP